MKKLIQPLIIVGLILFIFFKTCENEESEPQIIEVEVPAQSGNFEPQEPIYIQGEDSIVYKWKEVEVKIPNEVNDSLRIAYENVNTTNDSLRSELVRYKMYLDAIQIRDFSSDFEDEYLKLTISGKVQGKVQSIFPEYTIKPRTVQTEITPEKTIFRLLGGFEFGNNTLFNDFRYKANLGFQNQKGDIFMLGYERWNAQNYYWAGYYVSIFDIKK